MELLENNVFILNLYRINNDSKNLLKVKNTFVIQITMVFNS